MQARPFILPLLLLVAAIPAAGQAPAPVGVTRLHATRQELQQQLARFDQSARSGAYSPQLRARARYEASLIKLRLQQGDYQVGDRISLVVEGEPTLSDTLIVGADTAVNMPTGRKLSLRGVLRSEVQDRVQEAVAAVVKNPTVRTETFLRVGILGSVGSQGFYLVRSDAVVTDLLMNAGGPSPTADLMHLRVERDKRTIWDGEPFQEAITEGRTIDQLSLRAGDQLVVPAQKSASGGAGALIRPILWSIPALFGLFRMTRRH